ncbi:MAG: hypothetical protein ACK4VI_05055 [Alphaproteobacteria bacterium]
MPINSAELKETDIRAKFQIKDWESLVALGENFAQTLNEESRATLNREVITIGLIAPTLSGKSSFARGVYSGLGSEYKPLQMAMIAVNGSWDTDTEKQGLIRHFDMAVQPDEDDPDNFPMHWRTLEQGLGANGIQIVEHARKFRDPIYSCIIEIDKTENTDNFERVLTVYADDEFASTPAFRSFLADSAHYALPLTRKGDQDYDHPDITP